MPPDRPEWAISSRRVLAEGGLRDGAVLIAGGSILDVVGHGAVPEGVPLEDVGERVVMPGLVDSHVHINEPGRTAWEGFESATRAAAAGGITTLADMPLNCIPVTTTAAALHQKMDAARAQLWVDCGFYGGLVPDNIQDLEALVDGAVLGFKAFLAPSGIDEFPAVGESDLRLALALLAPGGLPLLVHAELATGPDGSGPWPRYTDYLGSRPADWELRAIELMIRLCQEFACPVHIVHLSSASALEAIGQARLDGLPFTVETCPHYLHFAAEQIPDGDTRFKCAPPIRGQHNREQLWQALQEGTIDFIVSDHSPCLPALKRMEQGDFQPAWGGIASLQLTLPVIWTEARQRGYSIEQVARWMCSRPAKLIGMDHRKGRLAPGFDADLIVWDPDTPVTPTPEWLLHRHPTTPYEGESLYGSVEQTYLRGIRIYDQGQFLGSPRGEVLLRGAA